MMKVSIDIDCTPEEARAFLGLPDVRALQEQMMESLGPEAMMKLWMPGGDGSAWEALQKSFWSQMQAKAAEKED